MRVVEYERLGVLVKVREDLKGRHWEHCLCFMCEKCAPGTPKNCPIVQATHDNCIKFNIMTPVWECPEYTPITSIGNPLNIVDYNPEWASLFEEEKQNLMKIFGDLVVWIHHVGSTAIKTTKAKPEIDILIVIKDDKTLSNYDKDMIALGYRVRGEGNGPGQFYYDKQPNNIKTHKVHIMKVGHHAIMDKLRYVKYLNENPIIGAQYADLKTQLALKYTYRTIGRYLVEKEPFIQNILALAKTKYENIKYDDFCK